MDILTSKDKSRDGKIKNSPQQLFCKNSKLYGRGVANNGFSPYAYMLAVKAVQQQNVPLPRTSFYIQAYSCCLKAVKSQKIFKPT